MLSIRPRLWPTVIAGLMLPILLGLGTWQLQRRTWKTDLLATIAARSASAPVAMPAVIDAPADWAFRHVRVSGHFADDQALRLYGRTRDGVAGVHLLAPLLRDDGAPILVDRGFVPFVQGGDLAPYSKAQGTVDIDGVVRLPEPAGWFLPSANVEKNVWYAVDIAAMSKALGVTLAPVYIAVKATATEGWPQPSGGNEAAGIRNEHLNYAIFWYSMAGVLVAIYILASRQPASGTPTSRKLAP